MYSNEFMEILDGLVPVTKAHESPSVPDSQFYTALGKLILAHVQLSDEGKTELAQCLASVPGSPSAARQALQRHRYPSERSKAGRKIEL